jgi:hypothetical protein
MNANANNLASMMLRRPLGGGDPILALFANGEQGAYYDPSDSSTVFQDAAMTTPAGDGDPVGAIMDKSGNGNHATQSTAAARPMLRQSGALWYLEFDGVDDFLTRAGILSGTQSAVYAAIQNRDLSNDAPSIVQKLTGSGRALYYHTRTSSNLKIAYLDGATSTVLTPTQDTSPHVYSWIRDGTSMDLRFDADEASATVDSVAHDNTADFWFGRWNTTNYADTNFYGLVVVDDSVTSAETNAVEALLAAKSGVTL